MEDCSRAAKSLLPDVDVTLVQALPGYEDQYEQWRRYIEDETELGRGDKAQEIVDYKFARMLTR